MQLSEEERKKMVEKLQKLLALATSPVEAEAKLAMEKAVQLMEKYSLSMADIPQGQNLSQEEMLKKSMVTEVVGGLGQKVRLWEAVLAGGIASAFDCMSVYHKNPVKEKNNPEYFYWGMSFVGTKFDVELAIWFHTYVRRSIGKLGKIHYPKNTEERDTFTVAMSNTIIARMKELYEKRNQLSDCKALIVVKTGAVEEYFHEQFPKLAKPTRVKVNGTRDAWMKGQEEGRKLNLSRPLNGGGTAGRARIGEKRKELQ